MMNDTISIVIPVYNHAKYVGDAIDSVLEQTLKPTQIIVVNDGSTDNTFEVISRYGSQITIINTANQGLGAATNTGLKLCKGNFFGRLDSDDIWESSFIEKMIAKIHADDLAASFCYSLMFIDPEMAKRHPSQVTSDAKPMRGLQVQCGLFRKTLVSKLGPFNENKEHLCDMEWIGKLVESGEAHAFVNEVLHHRRIHHTNLGHTKSNQVFVKSAFELIKSKRMKNKN